MKAVDVPPFVYEAGIDRFDDLNERYDFYLKGVVFFIAKAVDGIDITDNDTLHNYFNNNIEKIVYHAVMIMVTKP